MRPKLKTRVTLSLNSRLISAVDIMVKESDFSSRSAIIEQALQKWYNALCWTELNRQTEEYYGLLSSEEKEEDTQWAQMSSEQSKYLWD